MNKKQKSIFHIGFEIGLLLKGIHGLLEVIGGILMYFLSPARLNGLTRFLTKHELSEDPKDVVANLLIQTSAKFSISMQYFAVLYFLSHGIVKCILIFLLWKKKIWAYPLTIVVFILFIAYQIYRYTLTPSIFLIFLTILDLIMIALTIMEYKRLQIKA